MNSIHELTQMIAVRAISCVLVDRIYSYRSAVNGSTLVARHAGM